jgi:hypothetical protein
MEFEVKGHTYSVGKLDTFTRFEVFARGGSILPTLFHAGASVIRSDAAMRAILQIKANGGIREMVATNDGGALGDILQTFGETLAPIFKGISEMKPDDRVFVRDALLGCVHRKQGKTWAKIAAPTGMMFEDIADTDLLVILWHALAENFGGFFSSLLDAPSSDPSPAKSSG